jgi:hypothetical protein
VDVHFPFPEQTFAFDAVNPKHMRVGEGLGESLGEDFGEGFGDGLGEFTGGAV